ncbi:hypothetical protein Vadar_029233 [Vaccinium darrowii]|uniref:Uncharacterized protein n=1 Tax=Vaccinium darrowii TaxID=229202 RepID=A0ACB7XVQ8_9ERIC|nr:hypothetical protein Vadar_029233 [Vaccinium darrowii]
MNLENPSQEQEQERKRVKEHAVWLFACEQRLEDMNPPGFFQNSKNSRLRGSAISRIRQLAEIPEFPYEVLVQFHAITYFDRCFSNLSDLGGQECLDTFIITCTVLAGKRMAKSVDFPMQLFLEKNGLVNKLEDIEDMECRIRHMLNPRKESITALSFIDFFLYLIYDNDPDQIQTAKDNERLYKYILFMQRDAEFVQFKPSIIAAVAIMAEKAENGPVGDFCDPILRYKSVNTVEEGQPALAISSNRLYQSPPMFE